MKKYHRISLLVLWLSSVLLPVTSVAAEAGKSSVATATIDRLKGELGFSIIKTFPTKDPAITGYVVKDASGKTGLIFGMGPYLFSGTLIDSEGHDATRRFAQEQLPGPDYAGAAKQLTQDSDLITEGREGAPKIYVFADPNCIFCHKFWLNTRDWVKAGKVQIEWVMVGFLKSSSAGRAAAMMAAPNGAEALAKDERGFDVGSEEGAIKPLNPIPAKLKQALDRHAQLMSRLGFNGTPALLFREHSGKWRGISGLPDMGQLASSLGLD